MSETPPSLAVPSAPASQPKTSRLAVSSLVLGVLSFTCFVFFTLIPAVVCGHMALSRIRRSNGALTGNGLAIAGLVLGYTSILALFFWGGMMAAIAVPNFVKARQVSMQNACINNLRVIDGAKNQWALEKDKKEGDTPTATDLDPYIKGGFNSLHCPAEGQYSINPVGQPPTCTVRGHRLYSGP
jgi:general secretion pathway protein G